jgi:hypothetical protein
MLIGPEFRRPGREVTAAGGAARRWRIANFFGMLVASFRKAILENVPTAIAAAQISDRWRGRSRTQPSALRRAVPDLSME